MACKQFLVGSESFTPQAITRVSPTLTQLHRWVSTTVQAQLPFAEKVVRRSYSLRVGLAIDDKELNSAVAVMLQEVFGLTVLSKGVCAEDEEELIKTLNECEEAGMVMQLMPQDAARVALLQHHNALPQLVLSSSPTASSIHHWGGEQDVKPGQAQLPAAHCISIESTDALGDLTSQIIRLAAVSGAFPERRISLLASPLSSRKLLAEGVAAQYGLHRVCVGNLLDKQESQGENSSQEVLKLIQAGGYAPDELVNSIIKEQMNEDGDKLRGVLLDGFPRTLAQAEALQEAACLPQVVIVLQPEVTMAPVTDQEVTKHEMHNTHHQAVLHFLDALEATTVIRVCIPPGKELIEILSEIQEHLEAQLPMLAIPRPILIKSGELPSVRSDPPHNLYKTIPQMVECPASRALSRELWEKYKHVVTPLGTTMDRCIQPGVARGGVDKVLAHLLWFVSSVLCSRSQILWGL